MCANLSFNLSESWISEIGRSVQSLLANTVTLLKDSWHRIITRLTFLALLSCTADASSVSYGMLYAVILLVAQRYSLLDDRNHSNLLSPRLALTSVLLALAGLAGYACFSFLCGNQPDCNEIHPYVVFIPVSTQCWTSLCRWRDVSVGALVYYITGPKETSFEKMASLPKMFREKWRVFSKLSNGCSLTVVLLSYYCFVRLCLLILEFVSLYRPFAAFQCCAILWLSS